MACGCGCGMKKETKKPAAKKTVKPAKKTAKAKK
jgi:hypothetical protein